jgi:hypothetical protein
VTGVRTVLTGLAMLLVACGPPPANEAARFQASYEPYMAEYRASIDTENKLIGDSLIWLDSAITIDSATDLMDRWAKVYFVPRWMHQQLRFDRYQSPQVRDIQTRILRHLKERYFELHDYQRYAQRTREKGPVAAQLEEFRLRLRARKPAVDQVTPLLESLR